MADNKTRPGASDVSAFVEAVPDPGRKDDALAMITLMARLSGEPPVLWGPSIVGFGSYDYRYDSGHGGTTFRIGFSPRKSELVVYGIGGVPGHAELLRRLGKHRVGKACLYIRRLSDVDVGVLEQILAGTLERLDETHPRDPGTRRDTEISS